MTDHPASFALPGSIQQFNRFWSAHVDDLERHLSMNMWVLKAVLVAVIAFPIARVVIPAVLHVVVPHVVPEVVRTVLNFV